MTRIARLWNFLPLKRRALWAVVWEHGGLGCVLIVALAIRVWLTRWAAGYPTGDVWNFVSIAEGLRRFEYPVGEKRLPFYPLLVLVAHGVFPSASWEGAAVVVASTMSLVALALLYAVGRTLGLRKVPLLVGLLLFQSFRPFLAASLRGYADTTFLALVLGAILATLRAHTLLRSYLLAGLLVGAVPVTRVEGATVVPVLLVLLLVRLRRRIRAGALVILTAAIPIVLYSALALVNGRSVLPVAYLEETATTSYGVSSGRALLRNYGTLWEQLGLFEAWNVPRGFVLHFVSDPLSLPMWLANLFREPLPAAALLAVPGLMFFLVRRPLKQTAAVLLPFFALAVPIAWYTPLPRYTLFLYPLLILAAAAGLHAWSVALARATRPTGWGRVVRLASAAAVLVAAAAVWLPAHTQTAHRGVEKYRHHRLAYYRAVASARRLPGTIAFETEDSMTNLYFRNRGVYASFLFQKDADTLERWEALRARNVAAVVTTTSPTATFAFVRDPPFWGQAEEIAHFAVPQRDGRVDEHVIYRLTYAS